MPILNIFLILFLIYLIKCEQIVDKKVNYGKVNLNRIKRQNTEQFKEIFERAEKSRILEDNYSNKDPPVMTHIRKGRKDKKVGFNDPFIDEIKESFNEEYLKQRKVRGSESKRVDDQQRERYYEEPFELKNTLSRISSRKHRTRDEIEERKRNKDKKTVQNILDERTRVRELKKNKQDALNKEIEKYKIEGNRRIDLNRGKYIRVDNQGEDVFEKYKIKKEKKLELEQTQNDRKSFDLKELENEKELEKINKRRRNNLIKMIKECEEYKKKKNNRVTELDPCKILETYRTALEKLEKRNNKKELLEKINKIKEPSSMRVKKTEKWIEENTRRHSSFTTQRDNKNENYNENENRFERFEKKLNKKGFIDNNKIDKKFVFEKFFDSSNDFSEHLDEIDRQIKKREGNLNNIYSLKDKEIQKNINLTKKMKKDSKQKLTEFSTKKSQKIETNENQLFVEEKYSLGEEFTKLSKLKLKNKNDDKLKDDYVPPPIRRHSLSPRMLNEEEILALNKEILDLNISKILDSTRNKKSELNTPKTHRSHKKKYKIMKKHKKIPKEEEKSQIHNSDEKKNNSEIKNLEKIDNENNILKELNVGSDRTPRNKIKNELTEGKLESDEFNERKEIEKKNKREEEEEEEKIIFSNNSDNKVKGKQKSKNLASYLNEHKNEEKEEEKEEENNFVELSFISEITSELNYVKVDLNKQIGSGGVAEIYKGIYTDKNKEEKNVAVKLVGLGTNQTLKELKRIQPKKQENNNNLKEQPKEEKNSLNVLGFSLRNLKFKNKKIKQSKREKQIIKPEKPKMTENEKKMLENILENMKNEFYVLNEVNKYFNEEKERENIIKMFDGGKIKKIQDIDEEDENKFNYVIIMELGEKNFFEYIIELLKINKNKIEEKQIMKELVIPSKSLIQLHKVVIHLDFKPENQIFVKTESSFKLKTIDYGGSIIIPEDKRKEENAKIEIKNCTSSKYFLPPEINVMLMNALLGENDDRVKINVSRKTDSWQFGIMILQFILFNENRPCPSDDALELNKWKINILNNLSTLNIIFTLLIYKEEEEEFEQVRERFKNEVSLRDNYINQVEFLLKIRKEYSKLFLLVSNLMIEQDDRLSMTEINQVLTNKKINLKENLKINKFLDNEESKLLNEVKENI